MKIDWLERLPEQREGKRVVSTDEPCPDCGDDPDDRDLHVEGCRRIINDDSDRLYLQFGPPWYEWEDSAA